MKPVHWAIALLVGLNLTLLMRIHLVGGAKPAQVPLLGKHHGLELLAGTVDQQAKPFTLYIFFNADGSCGCLEDWPNWVRLARDQGTRLNIAGIFNGKDQQKFLDFAAGVDLPFPLYNDPGLTFAAHFNLTPGRISKVLVNSEGRLLLVDSHQILPRDQVYFAGRVAAQMDTP